MQNVFAVISASLVIAAAPPYIYSILKGSTRPERATWLIFSMLGIVAFGSQIGLGATKTLIFSGLDTLGSLLVLALAIPYGVAGFNKQDKIALFIAATGLVVSLLAKAPVIALFGVLLADASGMTLTLYKTFMEPGSEPYLSWLLFATGSVFAILAAPKLTAGILLYPLYIAIANYSVPAIKLYKSVRD